MGGWAALITIMSFSFKLAKKTPFQVYNPASQARPCLPEALPLPLPPLLWRPAAKSDALMACKLLTETKGARGRAQKGWRAAAAAVVAATCLPACQLQTQRLCFGPGCTGALYLLDAVSPWPPHSHNDSLLLLLLLCSATMPRQPSCTTTL